MHTGLVSIGDRSRPGEVLRAIRALSGRIAALVLMVAYGAPVYGSINEFEIEQISPGNYVHYGVHEARSRDNLGDNANIGFIVGEQCVLVFDTGGSRRVGEALLGALRNVTDKPICYVVISHVHPDHIFGAAAFIKDHPAVIGHENLPHQLAARGRFYREALERDLGDLAGGSEIVMPTQTIATGETITVDLGGRKVDIHAWTPAHTDDDVTVFDRVTSTLWLGDLLFVEHTPVLDSNITGFLAVMQTLRNNTDLRHYVPGHGRSNAPWPTVLDAQQRYFEVILKETRSAIRDNVPLMDAVNQVGLSEAQNWINFDTYHRRNVTTAYTELEWEE